MIKCSQFRSLIVQPALKAINDYSPGMEEVLVATCAQESLGGTYLKQERGSAVGIYQMEPKTYDSIWTNYLITRDSINQTPNNIGLSILKSCKYISIPPAEAMIYNLWYATMMARAFWLDIHEETPKHDNLEAIWAYYKKHWNTPLGKATEEEFFANYKRFTSNG